MNAEEKVKKEQELGKIVCEWCLTPLDPEEHKLHDILPTILICPNCGEALDQYGWVFGDDEIIDQNKEMMRDTELWSIPDNLTEEEKDEKEFAFFRKYIHQEKGE